MYYELYELYITTFGRYRFYSEKVGKIRCKIHGFFQGFPKIIYHLFVFEILPQWRKKHLRDSKWCQLAWPPSPKYLYVVHCVNSRQWLLPSLLAFTTNSCSFRCSS